MYFIFVCGSRRSRILLCIGSGRNIYVWFLIFPCSERHSCPFGLFQYPFYFSCRDARKLSLEKGDCRSVGVFIAFFFQCASYLLIRGIVGISSFTPGFSESLRSEDWPETGTGISSSTGEVSGSDMLRFFFCSNRQGGLCFLQFLQVFTIMRSSSNTFTHIFPVKDPKRFIGFYRLLYLLAV